MRVLAMCKVLPLLFVRDTVDDYDIVAVKLGVEMPGDDRTYHPCAASNPYHLLQPKNIVQYQPLNNMCRYQNV
jgi:hypothetical protein